jgi:lipoprotein-anchoring transpeptidase ErfK/SrfK
VSKHRSSHRAVRRRGRAGALALALGVTLVVGGAAVGVVPQLTAGPATADVGSSLAEASTPAALESATSAQVAPVPEPAAAEPAVVEPAVAETADPEVPADSGTGRRIVFDESDQRVWLVAGDESVERTYLVSGSRFDNLDPGTYSVRSKTRHATAFDNSGTMEYFVHFATGFSEPIGFHSVPRDNEGRIEQTKSQLGTPLSAGCVRQWEPDALALWEFAPVGTTVVVTA